MTDPPGLFHRELRIKGPLIKSKCADRPAEFSPVKGKNWQKYFMYFMFEQRITGAKDPKGAETAFILWSLSAKRREIRRRGACGDLFSSSIGLLGL